MPAYQQSDLVKVPFPYTDQTKFQRRPALVLSTSGFQEQHGLLWVVMVTSAENREWTGDVPIDDYAAAGLPAPSVIRTAKIATIDARDAEPLGAVPAEITRTVLREVARQIGLAT